MKKILAVLITASCVSTLALAQQDPQFSQNMFNRLYVNPAVAGSNEAICASLLYRNQWTGFDDAPKTIVAGVDAPFASNKAGVGLSFSSDKLGFESNTLVKLAGAYRFDLATGKLGIGVDLDMVQHSVDGDKFVPADPQPDDAIPGNESGSAFDLGAGLYYKSEKLYVGASAAHLMESKVDIGTASFGYVRHYYGMIGYTFDITPNIELKPSVFIKNAKSNTAVDVNANVHFNNRFWLGVSYRNEDAIVAMAGLNITENLRFGYSYDFTTSDLKDYNDGSHEIMLGYCFKVKKKITPAIRNVRFL